MRFVFNFYRNKKIFITGHTGFKGSWLIYILLFSGADITGYSLDPPTIPSLFSQIEIKKHIKSINGDIRDKDKILRSMNETKPDIVIHLAAQPLVRYSYLEPIITYETNVMGTVNILEAIRQTPSVRSFINVTTDKVYENKEWYWGYRENENLCGYDPYSNSKSCSELITFSYRNSFFKNPDSPAISTARSGNAIGGGDYSHERIIPACIQAIKKGNDIILRNPLSIRPYQHVLECLYGYLILAEKQYKNKNLEGAYNFGPDNSNYITTVELISLFCDVWGKKITWKIQNNENLHEANSLKLDSSKAKSLLGWKSKWDIKTAIAKVVEFAKIGNNKERKVCIENQINEYF